MLFLGKSGLDVDGQTCEMMCGIRIVLDLRVHIPLMVMMHVLVVLLSEVWVAEVYMMISIVAVHGVFGIVHCLTFSVSDG